MHGNLCLHTFTDYNFTWGGGVGDNSKQLTAAEKCIVESEKLIERLEKSISLKMYVCLEYQSILHDKINSACLKKSTIPLMFQGRK